MSVKYSLQKDIEKDALDAIPISAAFSMAEGLMLYEGGFDHIEDSLRSAGVWTDALSKELKIVYDEKLRRHPAKTPKLI